MNKIVELEEVSARYNHHIILENIDFVVKKNDFIGVIGPNGGGKTTLLKLIIGLLKPIKGTVHYYKNNKKVKNIPIGYLPQLNPFDKVFPISVTELVLSGLMNKKGLLKKYTSVEKELAYELMQKMNIYHLRDKAGGELSGGQLQRVLLVRAIISFPPLLILDEPNTYVDNAFEKDMYEKLIELNKKMAIIIVSHDVGIISSYIKTIACVNKTLHHHQSNKISKEILATYGCPIDMITHGDVPHRVLPKH